jgi:hypothetical protein
MKQAVPRLQGLIAAAAVASAGPVIPQYDIQVGTAFRTAGDAAYCDLAGASFFCFRPRDGFTIRIGHLGTKRPTFTRGYSDRYRGYRNERVRLLPFGRAWFSSDAEVITCWSRRSGLTCKHYDSGLTFWLDRRIGYRIYIQAPGRAPTVQPFFRTSGGVYCGLDLDTLEPSRPGILCWTPRDGLLVSIHHGEHRGDYGYQAHVKGLRPSGYAVLPLGHDFVWRCGSVDAFFAERCSTKRGLPIFRCASRRSGLTCRNRAGHGFWVGRNGNFSVF